MFFLALIIIPIEGKAQVGVKVEVPLTDLHVNGNVQIVNDLKVGGSDTILGDSGEQGQFLKSNGNDVSPEWVSLNIPIVPPGSFSLVNSFVFVDKKGIVIENGCFKRYYAEDELLTDVPTGDPNAKWGPLPELSVQS